MEIIESRLALNLSCTEHFTLAKNVDFPIFTLKFYKPSIRLTSLPSKVPQKKTQWTQGAWPSG